MKAKLTSILFLSLVTSICSFSQSKRLTVEDMNSLMTFKILNHPLKLDSALREFNFKMLEEGGGMHYMDYNDNLISHTYNKDQEMLLITLSTIDFEYYKGFRDELGKKFPLSQTGSKLGDFTCEVYETNWGTFFVGFGPENTFIIGRSIPIKNFE